MKIKLRQYCAKVAVQRRSQIFRQIVPKFCRHTGVCQEILVQYDGKYASSCAAKAKRRPLCGIALKCLSLISAAVIMTSCTEAVQPGEKMSFSDDIGIDFSLQVTPCVLGKSSGIITLTADSGGSYLYSSDLGMSYKKINDGQVSLSVPSPKSYSFRLMESDDHERVTRIYTVYAGDVSDNFTIDLTAVSSEETESGGSITVTPENRGNTGALEISIDSGETWRDMTGSELTIDSLKADMYHVIVREKGQPDNVSPSLNVPVLPSGGAVRAFTEVESILQNPELPTGCETTSLTMLLRYIGFDADKLTIADDYLPKGEYRKSNYNKVFVGNPRERSAYGCTAAVICKTAENYLADHDKDRRFRVRNITGTSFDGLYGFLDEHIPVIVWATIDMREILDNYVSWRDEESGELISWNGNEHCLLLTGYDIEENLVYVNDPLKGAVTYDMDIFEQRYDEMERNAVIITEN